MPDVTPSDVRRLFSVSNLTGGRYRLFGTLLVRKIEDAKLWVGFRENDLHLINSAVSL